MTTHEHIYAPRPYPYFLGEGTEDACTVCNMSRIVIEREADTPRINMLHTDCGGFLESFSTQGTYHRYRCEKCHAEVIAEEPPEARTRREEAREARERAYEEHRRTYVPPEPTGRIPTEDEANLIEEYRMWSEDHYAAGFMSPSEGTVHEFIDWQKHKNDPTTRARMWDYEQEMVDLYARLTSEDTPS